jgi:putative salt-induced outer membrane protein YdiY
MRTLILFAVLLAVVPGRPARAVEDVAPEEVGAQRGFSGNVSLSYSTKGGNTEKDETDFSAKVKYDSSKQYLAFLQGTYEKTTSTDVLTEDERLLHARYLHKLRGETLYGEGFVQYHNNVFQGIDDRVLTGGNGRWRWLDDPAIGKLYVGAGAFAETINYTPEFTAEDEDKYRLNSYLAYTRKLTDTATASLIGYYQPVIGDSRDYYISATLELEVRVISSLHLRIGYEYERDSQPPEGVLKTDDETKVSLIWKF